MPTKIKDVRPPHGLTRLLMRFPIWLFRMHLGWMVEERFLLLTHTAHPHWSQKWGTSPDHLGGVATRDSQRCLLRVIWLG